MEAIATRVEAIARNKENRKGQKVLKYFAHSKCPIDFFVGCLAPELVRMSTDTVKNTTINKDVLGTKGIATGLTTSNKRLFWDCRTSLRVESFLVCLGITRIFNRRRVLST